MNHINKSLMTNLIALLITVLGFYFADQHIKNIGFYALSGALTNWLAIYMLFEKIPFLYGSGIIPNKFESFKVAIKKMIMDQFFSAKNLDRYLNENTIKQYAEDIIISKIDHDKIFDGFIEMLMSSKYGSMIDMFLGGREGLEGLREPFKTKINSKLEQIITDINIDSSKLSEKAANKIESVIDTRLAELTPDMVKDLVQKIIREHLGWLVVWGGVFGGIIGLVASFIG
ncbi:DUF445 family protein [Francisella adeliensis]|uniref:DUF445 domain-containing protein n=1 Tax=Francisella adeliensis TaxID=2007306 RepID=A0A2Z4XYM6_9GAMM|nr:DUF445 family protein [Francisella adeliensis]AXA33766.1 DUF445 domain-containing protein [Francisella adeliensis]MBK2085664.1 DUF445 family protein [Francisella adeliensis]MBK2097542.1 DUF445 family protein [Francisella adeliensis]QIW12000.1 DUF445 family protein [Francisella adeliensis]QIW13875.1 DUF445 family protein [Francisella adeliensis]